MSKSQLAMKLLDETYGVVRLDERDSIPQWALGGEFFSLTRTEDELSIVCGMNRIPEGEKCEKQWKVLKVLGPLDFSLVGILASLTGVLAKASISIFAISTYDTDYILMKESVIEEGIKVLSRNGYLIE